MDFSRTRFMTCGGVCNLDVTNLPDMFAQCSNQIAFHALHMVQIVLVLEVWAVHFGKYLECLLCTCEQVAWSIEGVQGFDDYAESGGCGIIGSIGQVFSHECKLGL